MRKSIPKTREAEVLFLNRHACCICHVRGKDVQIHHIDGDSTNDDIANLAVLCLDCHSCVTGTRGLGKSYSPLEVKRYKREWEGIVKKSFGLPSRSRAKRVPRIERQLFVYEAKSLIYKMLCAKDSDTTFIESGFERLLQLAILEGIQNEILDHLGHAFTLSAISQVNKPVALARSLPKFFGHFFSPLDLPLQRSDERELLNAIRTLEFIHNFCVDENKHYKILSAVKNALADFMAIAVKYENSRVFSKARRILSEVLESSRTKYDEHDRKLPKLTREIEGLRDDMRKELKKAKLRWKI